MIFFHQILTGMPGSGKTENVLQYIKEYKRHYENGIIWLEAGSSEQIIGGLRGLVILT